MNPSPLAASATRITSVRNLNWCRGRGSRIDSPPAPIYPREAPSSKESQPLRPVAIPAELDLPGPVRLHQSSIIPRPSPTLTHKGEHNVATSPHANQPD